MNAERMVQIGTVVDVDYNKYKARVKFKDTGITSGWLCVLDNKSFTPDYNVPQKTENKAGGSGEAAFESHYHDLIIKQWMPQINDTVVALYMACDDSDGFVLGAIRG